jgi:hypothetical protein
MNPAERTDSENSALRNFISGRKPVELGQRSSTHHQSTLINGNEVNVFFSGKYRSPAG